MPDWFTVPWRRREQPVQQADPSVPAVSAALPEPSPGAAPSPPPKSAPKPASKIVMVTVLGLQEDALSAVIALVRAECSQAGTRPLFVTDGNQFSLFRADRSLFEQVIDVEVCRARSPGPDWHGYGATQYRLLGRKWKPITAISFGRQPDPEFLEAAVQGAKENL